MFDRLTYVLYNRQSYFASPTYLYYDREKLITIMSLHILNCVNRSVINIEKTRRIVRKFNDVFYFLNY